MTDDMLFALRDNGGVIQVCVLSDYVKELPENPEREAAFSKLREKYNQFQGLTDEEMNHAREEWYATDQKFPKALANVADLVDHIDYIVRLIGIDYVGIGTDFDGGGALSDCYDVSEIVNITAELVRRGYDEKQIEKIWGGNFLRVFSVVADKTSK
jgi:membrane dipeptidase